MKPSPRKALRNERLRRHWPQREVAERIGVTIATVNRWEQGVTAPSPYYRQLLCSLFEKSETELEFFSLEESAPCQTQEESQRALWDPLLPFSPHLSFPLIGRQELLEQLVTDLCHHQGTTYAIAGLPGVGKTALVLALAHHPRIRHHFHDGILWVGLGPAPRLAEAMNRWGTLLALDARELQTFTTVDALARCLHERLGERRMLLVLDDAWKLADAVSFQLGGRHCVHVVTTRFPLLAYTFARERVTTLSPLSFPESLSLFEQLAPQVSREYPGELRALAQTIDGLPLALVLLGRYLQVQSLTGSPRRLRQALQNLQQNMQARLHLAEPLPCWTSTPGYPVGAEISLQFAIDLSVRQLPPCVQQTLFQLALLPPKPQSFSEEAALAICACPVESLDLLVDSGLIEPFQTGRYQMHQTITDYARLQPRDPEIEPRFVRFAVSFLETHARDVQALDQDLPLLSQALEIAFHRQMYPLFLQGFFALWPFLEQRRLSLLAETLVQWAQQAASSLSDLASLARTWLVRGKMAAELRGEVRQAQHAYLEGLALARQTPHHALITELLILVGGTLIDTDSGNQAEAYLREGLQAIEQFADDAPRCVLFQYLGEQAETIGKTAEATSFYERGLALARQTHNWKAASALLQNLGVQAARQMHYAQADRYYQESLSYARQGKDLQRQSALLMNLGMLAWHQQDRTEAIQLSEESLQLAREIDHQRRISSVLQNLGMMMRCLDQDELAACYLQESLEVAQQIGHHWLVCETLGELGLLELKRQHLSQARHTFLTMHRQAQEMETPLLVALALFGLAQVAEQEGDQHEALNNAQESLLILRQLENVLLAEEVETWLGAVSQ